MSKQKHTLSDVDIKTELSSRRKFLRGLAIAGAGLATISVVGVAAADNNDKHSVDCKDPGGGSPGDSANPHDRGGCTMGDRLD